MTWSFKSSWREICHSSISLSSVLPLSQEVAPWVMKSTPQQTTKALSCHILLLVVLLLSSSVPRYSHINQYADLSNHKIHFTQLTDLGVTAYQNVVLVTSLNKYYGGSPETFIEDRRNYGPVDVSKSWFGHHVCIHKLWKHFIQTLTVSMDSKTPQLSITYATSDENTPDNTVQLEELISLNVSVQFPEVSSYMIGPHTDLIQTCCCWTQISGHHILTDSPSESGGDSTSWVHRQHHSCWSSTRWWITQWLDFIRWRYTEHIGFHNNLWQSSTLS